MLTIGQAAEHLGVSVQTIRKLCADGVLPFYRPQGLTGHRRFKRSELVAYLDRVRSGPKGEPPQVKFDGRYADIAARFKARRRKLLPGGRTLRKDKE